MFWGIGPEEKPPLRIAYRTASYCSFLTLKFGPSLYSRLLALTAEPSVPASSKVWQPPQRWLNIFAPEYSGSSLATSMPDSPQPATASAAGATAVARSRRRVRRVIERGSIRNNPPLPCADPPPSQDS